MKFRGTFATAITIIVGVFALAAIGSMITYPSHLLRYGPLVIAVAAALWALFRAPYAQVSDAGVRFRNVFVTIDIPWAAIKEVDTRWSLTIETADAKYAAWAVPATPTGTAPRFAGHQHHRNDAPAVAQLINERREELREAGHLKSAAAQAMQPEKSVNVPTLVIAGALLVGVVILQILG